MNNLKTGKHNEDFNPASHRDIWAALISEYIDGSLPAEPKTRLEQHLAECADCRADLAGMREAVFGLRRLPELSAPRSFVLTAAQARRLRPTPYYRVAQAAAAVAAVFLLFTLVLDFAGLNSAEAPAPVAVVAPVEPTATLEPIGTLAAGAAATRGAIEGFGGVSGLTPVPDPTAVPAPSRPAATGSQAFSNLRLIEIGLLLATLIFTVFAFALRPRAPGRLKL